MDPYLYLCTSDTFFGFDGHSLIYKTINSDQLSEPHLFDTADSRVFSEEETSWPYWSREHT
jgi:hypothetical protein